MKQPNAKGESKASDAVRVLFAPAGADMLTAHAPKALVLSSDENVKIEPSGKGFALSMPPNTAALWIRR